MEGLIVLIYKDGKLILVEKQEEYSWIGDFRRKIEDTLDELLPSWDGRKDE